VAWELRCAEPLIDVRFFRSAPFAGATVIAVCAFAALSGLLFLNTLYLQEVRGYSALEAGLCTLPLAGVTVIGAPISGRLVGSRGPRPSLLFAGVTLTAAALILVGLSNSTPLWQLLLAYLVFGLGFGVINAPITNSAVSGMPRAQAGVAAAVASTSRQTGQSLGVAILGSLVLGRIGAGDFHQRFASASHAGWWLIAVLGLVVLVLGALTSGRWARGTAERTAERLVSEEGERRELAAV